MPSPKFATITVIGRDKSGVVARVSYWLFQNGANIEALEEQVTRGQFSMTLQASWKRKGCDAHHVRGGLAQLGRELGMEITVRFTEPHRRQRVAIFVTRETHCLKALLTAFKTRNLRADLNLVIGNYPDLRALVVAHGVPFVHLPWEDRAKAELKALLLLQENEIDLVVLARFMKILSPNFVWRYKHKIINVHPSMLPSFPGPQAYRQAYEHGVKIIGATAHIVSMHLDEGPIIAQDCFRVRPGWGLKQIVAEGQKRETQVLLKAVKLYLRKKLDIYWGTVKLI